MITINAMILIQNFSKNSNYRSDPRQIGISAEMNTKRVPQKPLKYSCQFFLKFHDL